VGDGEPDVGGRHGWPIEIVWWTRSDGFLDFWLVCR
jgi:hypothetical protein